MSSVDDPYNVTAAILSSGIIGYLQGEDGNGNGMPELSSDGGIQVANVTSGVENDHWVLIGDAVILVSRDSDVQDVRKMREGRAAE